MWELGPDANEPEWQAVETDFSDDLFEVVNTIAGPYAIGDGGVIVADRGDGWAVVIDDGPNVRDNRLRGLDVTDDGERIWFAGSSGALGCYDVGTRRKFDYSYPNEMTSTWEGVAVSGDAGDEKLLVANGSGEILPVGIDGFDEDWGVPSKPAKQGSKMAGLAASPNGVGYAVDTSGNAFETTEDDGWEDIGIINAQVKFYDIWAGAHGRVYVAGGDGRLYRYDDSYNDWTPIGAGEESLRAFDKYEKQLVALGSGGVMYERVDGGERWEQLHTPTDNNLNDLTLGDPDVAVGKKGTILKRRRGEHRHAGTSADSDNYDGRGELYDGDGNAPEEGSDDGESMDGDEDGGSTAEDSTNGDSTNGDTPSDESADENTTSDEPADADSADADSTNPDSTDGEPTDGESSGTAEE